MTKYLLAIDQGTTSSRAIVFDDAGRQVAVAQAEFKQIYPKPGWVEHDPEEILSSTLKVCREAIKKSGKKISAIGITNQRETTIVWDRKTGKPIYNAIVWQDRRTTEFCKKIKKYEKKIVEKTGLIVDPYFSATKIKWILDNVKGARSKDVLFGTVDCFLLWHLTGGKVHATDATNASRTMIYNIRKNVWDKELLKLLNIPEKVLPKVKDSVSNFGSTSLFGGKIPITGIAGDQQAAAIGQGCIKEGMIKSTYGTGCFVIVNTGAKIVTSKNRLLTTIAYRVNGKTSYAIEGSIFIAGAVVQWLRDGLKIIKSSGEVEAIAKKLKDNKGVYIVPAFVGLGAPHWQPEARGAIFGLTRDTGKDELVRAALESVAYQTYDLLEAMKKDGVNPKILRVDGGMAKNDWLMQFLANILKLQVDRPKNLETTALGAAYLAALGVGIYGSLDEIARKWQKETTFTPKGNGMKKEIGEWKRAVKKTL